LAPYADGGALGIKAGFLWRVSRRHPLAGNIAWRSFLIAAVLAGAATAVQAQQATLPGGASSLTEVHGDWIVSCAITGEGEQARKACAMAQEQKDGKSGQRVVAIELRPGAQKSPATLAMPFGLDLASGVALQVDDGASGEALPYRTCLPAGCLVPFDIDAKMLASLRDGGILKLHAKADGGKETMFSISLKGFGGAFDRTAALTK
jgi:invasion protein IalB